VIKLFRDYVFHQVDANKNPITSLAHVMTCLNKLDAGSEERILLIARDDQSCIVATYKEIKAVVEAAFRCVPSYAMTYMSADQIAQRTGHCRSAELR
jgi:PAB-dependent poly(A)-specific ribonuclease subunit 3